MAKKEVSQAAEKVAAAEKKKDKKPANPNGNIFVRAGKAIKKFCKDLKGEIKKIVWPDAKTVLKSTLVVLAVVAVCGLAIAIVDWLLSQGLSLLEMAAAKVGESAADVVATASDAVIDHGDHTHVAGIMSSIIG
ncbi:MAG: preprotein translocase subunit SecE [Clostridia bacterium]|nr:preprotein translocase subunit SecE [Clostridia bacterium]